MIGGFATRRMGEYKKPDELLRVAATAVALDNVRGYRFRRTPNLASLFVHLKLWQVLERQPMHSNRYLSRQLQNLKFSVAHPTSCILPSVPRISHLASQLVFDQRRHSFDAFAVLQ